MASKFASTATRKRAPSKSPDTTNYAGGAAFSQDAKVELASLMVTSMVTDQYYRTAKDQTNRLQELLADVDPLFAAKAAVYARNKDGLRSITHVAAAEIVHAVKGEGWVVPFLAAVVRRPDDATEILAYYMSKYGKPVPTRLKKGLGKALGKFDAYQAAKYRGEGKGLSLVDLVNIVHPKPVEKNAEWLAQLVAGTLRSTKTWEAKVSAAGPDKEKKAAAWKEVVQDTGYLSLLRNFNNLSSQDDETLAVTLERLTDEKHIRKSLVFPFQFYVAAKNVSDPRVKRALNKALDISVANTPDFGNALVAIDHSGSMDSSLTGSDHITMQETGDLFAASLFKKNLSDVMIFGSTAGIVTLALNPDDSVASLTANIGRRDFGHSTNFNAIFEVAQKKYDTVVIFSDMQAWVRKGWGTSLGQDAIDRYRKRTGANPDVFAFDLAGMGTTQFIGPKSFQLAGFSANTLKVMENMKTDREALIREIEKVTF